MKKLLLILFLAVISFGASAQNSTKNWEHSAASAFYSWFLTTGGTINSSAYNPVTGNVYVADRGSNIYILNPATGAQTGILNKTGTSGSFLFSKVRVTSTGEIFAVSLSTGGGFARVYYWVNEAAAPVLLGDPTNGITIAASDRAGDAFAVTGSGTGVTLFISGTASSKIQVITTSGVLPTDFSKLKDITVTAASNARSCISPVTSGTNPDLWVSAPTVAKRLMTAAGVDTKVLASTVLTAPGTYTDVTTAGSISKTFSSLEYFEVGAKMFLATTGGNDNVTTPNGEGLALLIYDITDVNAIKLIESTKLASTFVANGNATCDIAIKKVVNGDGTYTMTFFQLITNNGIASHTLNFKADGTLPVELTSFNATIKNNQSTLNWTTASEANNAGFEIQSSSDGSNFGKIGFIASKASNGNSNTVLTYSFVDAKAINGTTYYRLKQIDFNGDFKYSDVKFIDNKLTQTVTFSVYPNPTSDYVEIAGANADGVKVQLFTTAGTEVKTSKILNAGKLNMTGLNAGIYVLRISKNGTLLQTTKLVKQ